MGGFFNFNSKSLRKHHWGTTSTHLLGTATARTNNQTFSQTFQICLSCQAKCFSVRPRRKTLIAKQFLLVWIKICFRTFLRNTWIKFCLSRNVLGRGQTHKHCLISKFQMSEKRTFDRLARALDTLFSQNVVNLTKMPTSLHSWSLWKSLRPVR